LQGPNKGGRYRDGSEDGESCGGEGKSGGKESFLAVLFASSWSYTSERELTTAHAVLQQSSRSVTATRDGATKGDHFINDVSD